MKDIVPTFTYDLAGLDRSDWIDRIHAVAEDNGDADRIGADHRALLIDAGTTLLVSFESVAAVRKANPGAAPLGWDFVKSNGWSSLTLLSDAGTDWYRTPALFGYFDRLIDDGFFEEFDQVLFYGAGAAGYAAATFSVAAPECGVLAIQPQATLAPARARWDQRFPEARRLDFSSRFAYAPKMVETASWVSVIHDPSVIEDAMHAALFDGANTTHFTCPYLGPHAARHLQSMGILRDLIEHAMEGALDRDAFAEMWRARRDHPPYLRTLMHRVEIEERHDRALARFCRQIAARGNKPIFEKKLEELRASGIDV